MKENFLNILINSQNILTGVIFEIIIILVIAILLKYFKGKKITILFELIYDKIFLFFEGIVGEEEKKWIKTYLVILFFVILIANFIGILLEFTAPIFGIDKDGEFILEHFIKNPTLDLNFTLALSISSIILLIFIQFQKKGWLNFFLEYFPITGKKYLFIEKGKINLLLYYPLALIVKIFDIILSFFISFLEIIGLFAKAISLAFRLFGNMISGSILITVIIVSLSLSSKEFTSFIGGFSFPIIFPLFIYLQEMLISLVQAFIFPMLIAIFIKTSLNEEY